MESCRRGSTRGFRAQSRFRRPSANGGKRFGVHGKEAVGGSSPPEGSAKAPQSGPFCLLNTCTISSVQ